MHCAARRIFRARIDDRTGAVLDEQAQTWSGTGLQYPEAPHLHRRGDWWYLLIAEGGTERGHAVSVARARVPEGPWEPCPLNPILSHRSTHRPIQHTGHADLVETPDGAWWMVLLGTRPRGPSPLYHVLGRETFLLPVDWDDDWPVPHRLDLEMPWAGDRPLQDWTIREDFDGPLAPGWLSVRRPIEDVASVDDGADGDGWLRLRGGGATLDHPWPVFVGRRQQHQRCRARALVERGDAREAGLVVRVDERHHVEVALVGEEVVVRCRIGPLSNICGPRPGDASRPSRRDPRRRARPRPDLVRLGWEPAEGVFEVLAEVDGRYFSTEVAGGMVGRTIGLYAVDGTASFDWFELGEQREEASVSSS